MAHIFAEKSPNLSSNFVDLFKEKFLNGELKPGQPLPSERELAAQYNVSRTTIRDAITTLRGLGLIEVHQGRCATVKAPSMDNLIEPLTMMLPMNHESILNLLEFREIFEPQCVFLATKRAAPSEIQKIGQYLEAMKQFKNSNDSTGAVEADFNFHQAIMQATHNEMIVVFSSAFRSVLYNLQKRMALLPNTASLDVKHLQVYEAIVSGDPKTASERMVELVAGTKARYIRTTANLSE